jgi:hypothetical protein
MSHRQKGEHKSRHRTHAIKPASLIQPPLAPMVTIAPEQIAPSAVIQSPHAPIKADVAT